MGSFLTRYLVSSTIIICPVSSSRDSIISSNDNLKVKDYKISRCQSKNKSVKVQSIKLLCPDDTKAVVGVPMRRVEPVPV